MRRLGDLRVEQNPQPGIALGHRSEKSRRKVALSAGRGTLRTDPRTGSEADRVLVFPTERTGDLYVLVV